MEIKLIFLTTLIFFATNASQNVLICRNNNGLAQEGLDWKKYLNEVLYNNLECMRDQYIKLHGMFDSAHYKILELEKIILNPTERKSRLEIDRFETLSVPPMAFMQYLDKRKRKTRLEPINVDENLLNAQEFLCLHKEKVDGIGYRLEKIFTDINDIRRFLNNSGIAERPLSGKSKMWRPVSENTNKKNIKKPIPDLRGKIYIFQDDKQKWVVLNVEKVYHGLRDINQCYKFYQRRLNIISARIERLSKKLDIIERETNIGHKITILIRDTVSF